jgi:hypothetical protein
MENENLTGQESLHIIQQMIGQAKQQFSDESFNYLLWGWLVFAASLGQYILAYAEFEYSYMVWLLMPLGAIVATIYNMRKNRKETVKTYIDEFFNYALVAFFVCLCIVLINQGKLGMSCYPMIMMVYGMWLYISGGSLKFKPFVFGGIANWILACAAFYVDLGTQLLLLALAVLVGYIIPGHMLRSRFKSQQKVMPSST